MKDTQNFLVQLNKASGTEESDFALKTFMRILFKGIYVRDQKIVKLDIHQPWKLCYEKGLECTRHKKHPQGFKRMASVSQSSILRPTADRWMLASAKPFR